MFDLISKKLTAEEQAAFQTFQNFNNSTPIRVGADYAHADRLRDKLGGKICTLAMYHWYMINAIAFYASEDLIEFMKAKGIEELPKGDPARENLTALRVMRSSMKKNAIEWENSHGFEVNSKCVLGLLCTISTIAAPNNSVSFDRIYEEVEQGVTNATVAKLSRHLGQEISHDMIEGRSKEAVKGQMMKLVRFLAQHGATGFSIC